MTNTVVFLGPTLSQVDARASLDATWRPPVEQGDVLRAVADGADVIGIVDGYFERVPSVWHKEILAALESGVHVFGASSMGALRAAELHGFGMVGVGEVFAAYRDGVLEDDDEVAVLHGSAQDGYRELSEAMVNVRDRCRGAIAVGALAPADADGLIAIAKELHYTERSYSRLRKIASERGLGEAASALVAFAASAGPSLKQRDAIAMLDAIARLQRDPPGRFQPRFTLERTVFLEALEREVDLERSAGPVPSPEELKQVTVTGELLGFARRKVLLRILARKELAHRGIEVSDEDVQRAADAFRRDYGLTRVDDMRRWMRDVGIGLEDFTEVMRDFAGLSILDELYARDVDRLLPQHLQIRSPGVLRDERS